MHYKERFARVRRLLEKVLSSVSVHARDSDNPGYAWLEIHPMPGYLRGTKPLCIEVDMRELTGPEATRKERMLYDNVISEWGFVVYRADESVYTNP